MQPLSECLLGRNLEPDTHATIIKALLAISTINLACRVVYQTLAWIAATAKLGETELTKENLEACVLQKNIAGKHLTSAIYAAFALYAGIQWMRMDSEQIGNLNWYTYFFYNAASVV